MRGICKETFKGSDGDNTDEDTAAFIWRIRNCLYFFFPTEEQKHYGRQ